jgi:hypothetical protein
MKVTKFLGSMIATTAIVGTIGLSYAQVTNPNNTGTSPTTNNSNLNTASPTPPVSGTMSNSTGTTSNATGTTTGSGSNMDSSSNMGTDATMDGERVAQADRG